MTRAVEMSHRHLYFHIGLHKTATTVLQKAFFPTLHEIEFLRTKNLSLVEKKLSLNNKKTLLVSHEEFSGSLSHRKRPGRRTDILRESLANIAFISPGAGLIIGFREHVSWLNSAYFEKTKKKAAVDPDQYLHTFAVEELLWCKLLAEIESAQVPVFGFLYEELLFNPHAFVNDICQFLGTTPPLGWRESLDRRMNPSPRSVLGQRVSRPFFGLSDGLKWLPRSKPLRYQLNQMGSRLGASLDRYALAAPAVKPNDELALILRADWNDLVQLLGQRRARDLSAFSLAT